MPDSIDYYAQCEEYIKQDSFLNNIQDNEAVQNRILNIQTNISTLDEQMLFALDEYKKYYVYIHKNPENTEYQQQFANAQANLTNIGSKFFEISNQIDIDTDLLNKRLECLNALIAEEKRKNVILKKRLGIIENTNNASSELIYDYKQIYDEGYLRNWALIISIIIVFISVKTMYSNVNGDMTSNVKNIASNMTNIGNNIYNKGSNMYNNMKNMGNNTGNNMGNNMGRN
jgi:hypothetical protein